MEKKKRPFFRYALVLTALFLVFALGYHFGQAGVEGLVLVSTERAYRSEDALPPEPEETSAALSRAVSDRVNLNTASADELTTLPGIGPVLAERIVAYRTEHGRIRSITELKNISGIGEVLCEQLAPYVTVY